jgi:ATP-dependent Zn protease
MEIDNDTIDTISAFSSKLTPGFSGADISNVVNEAGIIAVRNHEDKIYENNIKEAIDYVMMGSMKENTLLEKEKTIVAYHEAGHAYLSYIFEEIENPVKVSIVPREKGMLGFSQSETSGDHLTNKSKIEKEINVLMGGRASEEIFCENITNGASNDIEKATHLIRHYVKVLGFGKNTFVNQTDSSPYKNEGSNYIKDLMDEEIIEFLNSKYDETLTLIRNNTHNVSQISKCLLEKQTIYLDDIESVIDKNKINID